jgi:hypothetical protein
MKRNGFYTHGTMNKTTPNKVRKHRNTQMSKTQHTNVTRKRKQKPSISHWNANGHPEENREGEIGG